MISLFHALVVALAGSRKCFFFLVNHVYHIPYFSWFLNFSFLSIVNMNRGLCVRFVLGFAFPPLWYYATVLYFGNYYLKDPRERPGLAASAIAVS